MVACNLEGIFDLIVQLLNFGVGVGVIGGRRVADLDTGRVSIRVRAMIRVTVTVTVTVTIRVRIRVRLLAGSESG